MAWFKTPKQMLSTFTRGAKTIKRTTKKVLGWSPKTGAEAFLASTGVGVIGAGAVRAVTAGVVKLAPVVFKSVAPKVVKTITPTTMKGKFYAGTGAIIGAGVLKESPIARGFVKKRVRDVPKIPKKIFGFGGELGKVIEKEKTFGKEDVVKGLKTAGVIGGVLGVGALVIPKVIEKIKEKKEKAIEETPTFQLEAPPEKQLITEKPLGIQGETPVTPETTTISTGKKRYKRRRAKKTTPVRQSVKINILNRSTSTGIKNTTYLKERLLN